MWLLYIANKIGRLPDDIVFQGKFRGGGLRALMKKIGVCVMAFMLSLLLFGCEEIENKDGIEMGEDSRTSLVEKIDLSAISAPKEAAVYSAVFFDREPEEIAHIFLGNDFEEGETAATGRMFLSDVGTPKEKILYAYDSGRAFYGDSRLSGMSGVNFGSCLEFCYNKIYTNNDEYATIRSEYCNEGWISSEGTDGQDGAFSEKQKRIAGYLGELGVEGYELYSAGMFPVGQKKGCLMYFKQIVDGIPVSHILFENQDKKMVYNHRYSIVVKEVSALDADVQVCFFRDELVDFYCSSLINTGRQLKKYPLVSVHDAYEKVKGRYPAGVGTDGNYELERAELQYELLMLDESNEKLYLYPVWIFGVHNKGDIIGESEWAYYMVDAITGEFFSDIPEELRQ